MTSIVSIFASNLSREDVPLGNESDAIIVAGIVYPLSDKLSDIHLQIGIRVSRCEICRRYGISEQWGGCICDRAFSPVTGHHLDVKRTTTHDLADEQLENSFSNGT